MAAKLLLLILAAAATAASLLVIRHERIETAYEISRTHRQAMERRRTLWALRWTIAERCRPEEVERLMTALGGDWNAIARRALVDADGHTDVHAHTDADAHTDAHTVADTDAHAHTVADTDAVAHAVAPAPAPRLVIAAPGVSRD